MFTYQPFEKTNGEIILMFHDIPTEEKVIVLFEDFDAVFDGRKPQFEECSFTFDSILNAIDGVFINTKNMLFVMTTNNLNKIDKSLRHRPSRFDFVLSIQNPEYSERLEIFKSFNLNGSSEKLAELTNGQSGAVVCEIAKRSLSNDKSTMELQVEEIIDSFRVE